MKVFVYTSGASQLVYSELIDLRLLGINQIERGSHVEPTSDGSWQVDLSPVGGPILGPFQTRSNAIQCEISRLNEILAQRNL